MGILDNFLHTRLIIYDHNGRIRVVSHLTCKDRHEDLSRSRTEHSSSGHNLLSKCDGASWTQVSAVNQAGEEGERRAGGQSVSQSVGRSVGRSVGGVTTGEICGLTRCTNA